MINIGEVINERYEIVSKIGSGAQSNVYKAKHLNLDKFVVVKEIRQKGKSVSDALMKSLKKESDILKDLDHPGLPRIYDIIEEKDEYVNRINGIYIVMDYIDGSTLEEVVINKKSNINNIIDWAKQLSDVLAYIHGRKNPILHRDLKPSNVMITSEGKIKLIDFGIASMEEAEDQNKGGMTASYASPEQIAHSPLDCRSDIYSFGATLYALVTVRKPKDMVPIREINPSWPEGLEYIITKCTKIDPEERYQDCFELKDDIKNIKKLTKDYKKQLLRQLTGFFVSAVLMVIFIIITVIGSNGDRAIRIADYKTLINQADMYMVDDDYTKAIETLDDLIMNVDGSKEDAYIKILNIYSNMNNALDGIQKVEGYINDKFEGVNKNNEVLFKLGMTYLDIKNYPMALKYFNMVNDKKIEDAFYYKTLTATLSTMEIEYDKFQEDLMGFEAYNDELPKNENKLANYNSLANIYISYKGSLANANEKVIELVNKANDILKSLDDETLNSIYESNFINKLAQAYHSKGINEINKETAAEFFEEAIYNYELLLDMNGRDRGNTLIKIGEIYYDLGNYSRAIEQLNMTITEYPQSIKAYVKLVNILLDVEQNKSEENRNYSTAVERYNAAKNIPGSDDDLDFNKLKRRVGNLGIL